MNTQNATRITGLRRWPGFLDGLRDTVLDRTQEWSVGDRTIHAYHNWFRDHIHMLKFARYFHPDPKSTLGFLLAHQHSSGFFYEILTSTKDGHVSIVADEFRKPLEWPVTYRWRPGRRKHGPVEGVLLRLEVEPDIEYLMVEGVARAWEASGDTAWMESALLPLVNGLRYSLNDPVRFDQEHGLVKRPFTIDTWDFAWGQSTADREIHPGTPMSIHYGDNAGVYAAARWLSERIEGNGTEEEEEFDAADRDGVARPVFPLHGPQEKSWHWWADEIRRKTNDLCWNGSFYTHQVLLEPIETGGPREDEILSLSNTYAINRGLADHAQAVSIIECYRRLREETKDTSVAEWFTIYPPYPDFAGHRAWDYVNGGIAPFVGGELALAAFRHGYEMYGVDIIDRLYDLWKRDGGLLFLYSKEGKPPENSWGPVGWGAAAVGQAILEGLAGVSMNAAEGSIRFTPRWTAAGEDDVTVEAGFPSSGFGASYRFVHQPKPQAVRLECVTPGPLSLSVLLPVGKKAEKVTVDGVEASFRTTIVEKSTYICLENLQPSPPEKIRVEIGYRAG
jgi:hypothetical protein